MAIPYKKPLLVCLFFFNLSPNGFGCAKMHQSDNNESDIFRLTMTFNLVWLNKINLKDNCRLPPKMDT